MVLRTLFDLTWFVSQLLCLNMPSKQLFYLNVFRNRLSVLMYMVSVHIFSFLTCFGNCLVLMRLQNDFLP